MKLNEKKKYSIFNNPQYAISGLIQVLKTETSFKLELIFITISIILAFILDLDKYEILFIILTAFFILIIELLNSSIENIVDLVTEDYKELAKYAKDIAATAVMFSIILHILVWIVILFI